MRDLDCEDEPAIHQQIIEQIESRFHNRVEIHFAVQEIEAWMIAHPDGFCAVYPNAPPQLLFDIKKLVPLTDSPETFIDCDPKPAEHLERLTAKNGLKYRKTIEGPQALRLVEPDMVAIRCPHFQDFRDSLRQKIAYPS